MHHLHLLHRLHHAHHLLHHAHHHHHLLALHATLLVAATGEAAGILARELTGEAATAAGESATGIAARVTTGEAATGEATVAVGREGRRVDAAAAVAEATVARTEVAAVVGLTALTLGPDSEEVLNSVIQEAGDARDGLACHNTGTGAGHNSERVSEGEDAAYDAADYTTDNRVTGDVLDGGETTVEHFTGAFDDAANDRAERAKRVTAQKFASAFDNTADHASYAASYAADYISYSTNYSTHFESLQVSLIESFLLIVYPPRTRVI